ncbi:RDD family protein [Rarobacter faecitabidus]|uniref:RDD family protein n=1 Tax=Rarobacter faecitabidus TaxID=13243 RepID=UPI001FE51E15|nr:RDD family protein [Rarobacter faecitabidus]
MKRKDLQGWLYGAPESGQEHREAVNSLNLPAAGPGSRARLGRRVIALFIDWWASWLIAYLIFGDSPFGALGVFAVENLVLTATVGATFGQRLCSMTLVRLVDLGAASAGTPRRPGIGFVPALVRTVLLCLVIPAVVWDADGRGLHDKAAGTVLLRRR